MLIINRQWHVTEYRWDFDPVATVPSRFTLWTKWRNCGGLVNSSKFGCATLSFVIISVAVLRNEWELAVWGFLICACVCVWCVPGLRKDHLRLLPVLFLGQPCSFRKSTVKTRLGSSTYSVATVRTDLQTEPQTNRNTTFYLFSFFAEFHRGMGWGVQFKGWK